MSNENAAVLRPWTVKAMPEELTQRAVAAARRRQETVAELVSRALARELDSPFVMMRSDQIDPSKPESATIDISNGELQELERLSHLARLLTPEGKRSKSLAEAQRLIWSRLKALATKWEAAGNELNEQHAIAGPDHE